ncbi:hypothetical protein [uncultured Roseobacter sp.]|uniref:hypothetical protein n=1 Tax=uncultured Roseobacter sp. TaxID=114847 RepID=UPI002623B6B5|nr:hypothetical protein [uncultured Roseobacter sp.]
MLPTHTTRIEIPKDTLEILAAEKSRTGLGPAAIYKYAKALGLIKPTTRLDAAMIKAWMQGKSRSAYSEGLEAVIHAYLSVGFESELPEGAHPKQLVLLTDGTGHELANFLKQRSSSVRALMLTDEDAPEGLTAYKLKRLAEGKETRIELAHLLFLRRIALRWANSNMIQKDRERTADRIEKSNCE